MMAFTEMPSETLMKEYNEVRLAYPKALAELNAVYEKAANLAPALQAQQVALTAPAKVVWSTKPTQAPAKARAGAKERK
jgi:hypothetical protein